MNIVTSEEEEEMTRTLAKFRGLSLEEFNFYVQNYLECSEVEGVGGFRKITDCGSNILILKAGFTSLRVPKGYKHFQEGYHYESEEEFSRSTFESELNSADIVVIPVSIFYLNHRSYPKFIPSKLNGHTDHAMLILYFKKEQKYILVDSLKVSPTTQEKYKALHRIQAQIIPFFKERGLKGKSTCHIYDKGADVPVRNGCCPAVLWCIKHVLEDTSWRPEKDYGSSDTKFHKFTHQIIEFLALFGFDATEPPPPISSSTHSQNTSAFVLESARFAPTQPHLVGDQPSRICDNDEEIVDVASFCFMSTSTSKSEHSDRIFKQLQVIQESPPGKRNFSVVSASSDIHVGGGNEVETISIHKRKKQKV
ncbi:unnamed protein product [Orchesella dallaii]|uniref:Ubiquitin-like protease family profile domain-containing protein n=1 Tax=Orchesella dallaii TaxID=48710 RepID=A0ABP1RYM9_9HEXA